MYDISECVIVCVPGCIHYLSIYEKEMQNSIDVSEFAKI